jgi:signal transduction histidine kinase/AmiR/NasT family two-component response regulator
MLATDLPHRGAEASRRALLKTGALQAAILSSANFSSIATDEAGVIQVFNVGAERMLGYAASDVIDRVTPAALSDPVELVQRAQALSAEVGTTVAPGFDALVYKAARGVEDIYELTYLCRDGSRLPALVSVSALRDAKGALIGYLLIGTDNTSRQRLEMEQTQLTAVLQGAHLALQSAKADADRANQAKSDFLSSMSHELRSPLNAILGFAQLMDSGVPAPTAAQRDSITQILQAGWYLLELINEVLDLSLIESGRLSMSLEPLGLDDLLADCRAMIAPQALQAGITLHFPAPGLALLVKADRTRAKQVVVNLLSNAIKYNRPGGTVEVTASVMAGGGAQDGQRVRLSVSDTGPGLAPDKLAGLFEPFNRLGQEGGLVEGTGIGLVVSKRLTALMGGAIGVDSQPGLGSTFWVELLACPLAPGDGHPQRRALGPHRATAAGPVRYTVLCVEDNPANLQLVTQLLARRGDIRLLSAGDGRSGVELARSARPDVVLMDINLPGISGITALHLLAADAATARIPVLALSANAMPSDIEQALQAGFFGYLTKPIRLDVFFNALDGALAHADATRQSVPQAQPVATHQPA